MTAPAPKVQRTRATRQRRPPHQQRILHVLKLAGVVKSKVDRAERRPLVFRRQQGHNH
jgi:hypothetical protein